MAAGSKRGHVDLAGRQPEHLAEWLGDQYGRLVVLALLRHGPIVPYDAVGMDPLAASMTCDDGAVQLIFGPDGGAPRTLDESDLVELYRYPAPEGRGWVRSNFVMSLDGSVQGPDGRSGTINTESDHHVFALQRALADAILVGANTVRFEGYRAVDLEPWQLQIREQEGLAPYPVLVIISASADLDPSIATPAEGVGGAVVIITTCGKESR